jgi:hypothetical protein
MALLALWIRGMLITATEQHLRQNQAAKRYIQISGGRPIRFINAD